mmetsp:Transcript_116020/g.231248  ORF Transcript_116020/g.231248 Transcript_116020/m.231248 type:complete len:236 (-) Transcript_116020:2176-2883(-)
MPYLLPSMWYLWISSPSSSNVLRTMSSGGHHGFNAVAAFFTASLKSPINFQAWVALIPLSSHKYLILPCIMKSSIQLLVGSRDSSPNADAATAGKEVTSRCITFLVELARSDGEEKLSPMPAMAEKGDLARYLTMCWMNFSWNGEPFWKGCPRGSQEALNDRPLNGKTRSASLNFVVDPTHHASSWKSSCTPSLYFLTASNIGLGSGGREGLFADGRCFLRGARSFGILWGKRLG